MSRLIHSLTDLVTGTPATGHRPLYHLSGGWKTVKDSVIDARSFGVTADGTTDDAAALSAAITAANVSAGSNYSTGGAWVVHCPPGVIALGSLVTVPSWVALRGAGQGLTTFKLTDAAAGLKFTGAYTSHGGFTIDGTNTATTGIDIRTTNQSEWKDIQVYRCTVGIHTYNMQNSAFVNVNPRECGTGLYLDDGTGSCIFQRCEIADNTVYGLRLGKSGTVSSGYVDPTNNLFVSCVLEHTEVTTLAVVFSEASTANEFHNCVLVHSGGAASPIVLMTKVAGASQNVVQFSGPNQFTGSPVNSTAFTIDTNSVVYFATPGTTIQGFLVIFSVATNGKIRGFAPDAANFTTYFLGTGGASESSNAWRARREQELITRPAFSDYIQMCQWDGASAHGFRYSAAGKIEWGSGSATPDTNLYRSAANTLKTDDKLVTVVGLGVGNSAAATTLGSVTKKMEVFDASGVSLGFVAIYDAIT